MSTSLITFLQVLLITYLSFYKSLLTDLHASFCNLLNLCYTLLPDHISSRFKTSQLLSFAYKDQVKYVFNMFSAAFTTWPFSLLKGLPCDHSLNTWYPFFHWHFLFSLNGTPIFFSPTSLSPTDFSNTFPQWFSLLSLFWDPSRRTSYTQCLLCPHNNLCTSPY